MESKMTEAFPSFDPTITTQASATISRGRRRANAIGGEHPLENPICAEEARLAQLARNLTKQSSATSSHHAAPVFHEGRTDRALPPWPPTSSNRPPLPVVETSRSRGRQPARPDQSSTPGTSVRRSATVIRHLRGGDILAKAQAEIAEERAYFNRMNYQQNYVESSQAGQSPGPRQAPQSPSQGMNVNGVNGGGLPYGLSTFPTPAGHQADLNFIMSMVDDLSQQLQQNRDLTAGIVEKMGQVRDRALEGNFSNEELLGIVSGDIRDNTKSLDQENSDLRRALTQALYDKDENWKLVLQAKNILEDTLEKVHDYRAREDTRILAWHRSYRNQLAEERAVNLNLNNHILDMQMHAGNAMEYLRRAQRLHDDSPEWQELHIQNDALRKECRQWKRMAMPLVPEDSDFWSDDDDIIDPEEKKRLARIRDENQIKFGKRNDMGEGPSGSV